MNDFMLWMSGVVPGAIFGAVAKGAVDAYRQAKHLDWVEQSLTEELHDIRARLLSMKAGYVESLEAYAVGVVYGTLPLKSTNSVHKKHYADVANRFGASKRESARMIDAYVDTLNDGIQKLIDEMPSASEERTTARLDEWGGMVKAQFRNVTKTLWHVEYHLRTNHPFLDVPGSADFEDYVKAETLVEFEIEEVLDNARINYTIDRFAQL